jgi:hypothetical protein
MATNMKVYLTQIIIFIFFSGFAAKALGEPIRIDQKSSNIQLGKYMQTFLDKSNQFSWEQFEESAKWQTLFSPSESHQPTFGVTEGTSWARFQLENPFHHDVDLYFENQYAMTDELTIVQLEADGHRVFRVGDRVKRDEQQTLHRLETVHFSLKPGVSTFYASAKTSGPNKIALALWGKQELHRKVMVDTLVFSLGIGFILALTIYNFFIFLSLRYLSYLYYVLYSLSFLVMELALTGLWNLVLFLSGSTRIWLMNWGFLAATSFVHIFGILFSIAFLRLHKDQTKLLYVAYAYLIFASVHTIAILEEWDYAVSSRIINASGAIVCFCLLGVGIRYSLKRYRPAYFYTLAWSFMLITGIALTLSNVGILPGNDFTNFGTLAGVMLEISLLSLALADRVKVIEQDRHRDRDRYVDELKAKEVSIQHSYSQMAKMVYPHQIHQMQQGRCLEETMPVGKKEAVIICLDIVNSSKLPKEGASEFMLRFLQACYNEMSCQYDSERMTSKAFLINQTGDGFLCSVGYPFSITDEQNPSDLAVSLAQRFMHLCSKHAGDVLPNEAVLCGIGIAKGSIETSFNPIGTVSYYVRGWPLTIATRYESARKLIFPNGLKQSTIILQEKIFDDLSEVTKGAFVRVDFAHLNLSIRDDREAVGLYYTCYVDDNQMREILKVQ